MSRVQYLLFVLPGASGPIYGSIWTRYLGLFVGHDAYAWIIVLVIFLGGMAGAVAVSRYSERLREPKKLRDGTVMAKLHVGDVAGARQVLDTLSRHSLRPPGDLRSCCWKHT